MDPAQVAHALGLDVVESPLDSEIAGALVKIEGQDPHIVLNSGDHQNRQRFTCAHEIGHFVERGGNLEGYDHVDFRDQLSARGTDPSERYANEFAACLLMPEHDVRRFYEQGLGPIEMALRFKVSADAMNWRLHNLGLRERITRPG